MNTQTQAISESITFALARVCMAHRINASRMLAELGLHVGQEMLLQNLWQDDNLTQSDLADRLCIQLATANKMIRRMEQVQLVSKVKDIEDGRVSRVQLTQKGRDLQASTEHVWAQVEQRTLTNFTEDEKDTFRQFLQRINQNLSPED